MPSHFTMTRDHSSGGWLLMASVAESSVASVPLHRLAELEAVLMQPMRALSSAHDAVQQPEDDEASNITAIPDGAAVTGTSNEASGERSGNAGDAVVPESADAYCTPRSSPRSVPRLRSSKSAPPPLETLDATIAPSPSQEAFATMTRASSFHGYSAGDTQPMESQVYRDYTESMAKPAAVTPRKTVLNISPDGKINTCGTTGEDGVLESCVEGDTGFVDLGRAFQPPSPTAQSTSDVEELLASPSMQVQILSDNVKQSLPKTPSLAGHKHGRNGEMLTSQTTVKKTPGYTQLFGGGQNAQMLSATQLFEQTQAPSSPMPEAPRSDPVVTRPSPNLDHQLRASSPIITMSSPVATYQAKPLRATAEPRETYTSMRESQERRAAKLREELGLQQYDDGMSDEDEEHDAERRRFERKRLQRVKSDQALSEWSRVRAPVRPGSRPTSSPKPPMMIDLVTPATTKKVDVEELDVSSLRDHHEDELHGDEDEVLDEMGIDNDEYDELAQTVLRSQSNPYEDESDDSAAGNASDESENDDDDQVLLVTGKDPGPQMSSAHENQDQVQNRSATQHSAIADSQPLRQQRARSLVSHQPAASSLASFVPGSQYAGKTSQDQAHMIAKPMHNSQPAVRGPDDWTTEGQIPSSPPLIAESHSVPADATEASAAQGNALADSLPRAGPRQGVADREIPESDLPGLDDMGQSSPHHSAFEVAARDESNSVPLFSTAQTHVPASDVSPQKNALAPSPLKMLSRQASSLIMSQSPRTAAGVRHFSEIAAAPSPPKGSLGTEPDVEVILSDVMTTEDQQFMQDFSSPPVERASKRRRVERDDSTRGSLRAENNDLPQLDVLAEAEKSQEGDAHDEAAQQQVHHTALRDSPNKANERPMSTPAGGDVEQQATPESVKAREQAGAKAVSQVLSKRLPKPAKKSGKRTENLRKTKASAMAMQIPAGGTRHIVKQSSSADGPSEPRDSMQNITKDSTDVNEGAERDTGEDQRDETFTTDKNLHTESANRVFALFKGNLSNFYPATWMGSSPDGTLYRVRFDDGTIVSIESQHVRKLDLQIGDTIKVDVSGMRNKTWTIQDFGGEPEHGTASSLTDGNGRTIVKVHAKSSRSSLATSRAETEGQDDSIEVAVENIYLTHTMWPRFDDRVFHAPSALGQALGRPSTPSTGFDSPDAVTPGSRVRRKVIPTAKIAGGRPSHLSEQIAAPKSTRLAGQLFFGMAFAISYISNEAEKATVTRLVQGNGGLILEQGFEELFDLPNLDEATSVSPAKKSSDKDSTPDTVKAGLRLKSEYRDLGFVALIADKHSRRAKYIQALALGLPTLSGKWIIDSVDNSKNPSLNSTDSVPVTWTQYLLPAGESSYLGGAIRSRTIRPYEASLAKLLNSIKERDILLNGDGVLIVASKKGKGTWERRKAYAFLTLALGAGQVRRVSDLLEGKAMMQREPENWKWMYVGGSVSEASKAAFGNDRLGGQKRKRDDEDLKVNAKAIFATDGKIKVVNDEFVVQSLILGALVDG